jgi:hypothetical protein
MDSNFYHIPLDDSKAVMKVFFPRGNSRIDFQYDHIDIMQFIPPEYPTEMACTDDKGGILFSSAAVNIVQITLMDKEFFVKSLAKRSKGSTSAAHLQTISFSLDVMLPDKNLKIQLRQGGMMLPLDYNHDQIEIVFKGLIIDKDFVKA